MARSLYLNSSLSNKDIAKQVGTTEKTLRKWRTDEDWDTLKELKTITRSNLLQDAYAQLKTINKQIDELDKSDMKTRKILFDAKAVLGKEIDRLSESPLHVYIGVFDEFTDWISKNYPKKLQELTAISFEFIEVINLKKH